MLEEEHVRKGNLDPFLFFDTCLRPARYKTPTRAVSDRTFYNTWKWLYLDNADKRTKRSSLYFSIFNKKTNKNSIYFAGAIPHPVRFFKIPFKSEFYLLTWNPNSSTLTIRWHFRFCFDTKQHLNNRRESCSICIICVASVGDHLPPPLRWFKFIS